jgi:Holliday junction resolvasome RuvABC endonuclease subunit
LRILALD